MKKTLLFASILLSLAIVTITPAWCQDAPIISQVNAFYDAVEKADQQAILALVIPEITGKIKEDPSTAGVFGQIYSTVPIMKEKGGTIVFGGRQVKVVNKEKDQATVEFKATVTITKADGEKKTSATTDTVSLKLVEGKWLLNDLVSK